MRETITLILTIPAALTCFMTLVLLLVYLLRWRPTAKVTDMPSVSIFVPYYNEQADVLLKALDKLDAQKYPQQLQVVIIDDGSTNNTPSHVKEWLSELRRQEYVVLTREENGGRKGFALDHALDSGVALGDVYVVVDSDTYIAPDGIYELAAKLWSDPKYAAVCGYISPDNHRGSLIGRLQYYEHIGFYGAIRAAQDQLGVVPVLAGAFVAHRASAVKEIGGWSEWLVEDIAWCWKAIAHKYRTGYAADAVAVTQCPLTHKELFKQRRRWARGRVEAYMAAWKVSKVTGMLSTPWFLVTALQFLFPPSAILLPVLIYFQIWPPVILGGVTIVLYMAFTGLYLRRHGNKTGVSRRDIAGVPLFSALLETITWLPNILGYIDEIRGKKKHWLTR
jgi:biofilm PGA synthesis N-glycosyltransferase PgaC